jgi:hypothetical protein
MRRGLLAGLSLVLVGGLVVVVVESASAAVCCASRVSLGDRGQQGNADAFGDDYAPVSKTVHTFESIATNLVSGDTNGATDVFVRVKSGGRWHTERVSVGPGGRQGNDSSFNAVSDGRGDVIAFDSLATNLVDRPDATPTAKDVYVRDRRNGRTERVSVSSSGVQSDSGGQVVEISSDGRLVLFSSWAGNLVPGASGGHLYLRDRSRGTTELVDLGAGGQPVHGGNASMSADGRYVAFVAPDGTVPGDANGFPDIYLRDRRAGTTELVSVATGGRLANDDSTIYRRGTSVTNDGRFVVFESDAGNLVAGDTNNASDVFVRDRRAGTTERVSVGVGGEQGNAESFFPMIAAGRGRPVVAFLSHATNLGGRGIGFNLYVRDHRANKMVLAATGVGIVNLDPDGCVVSYDTNVPQMPGDTNGFRDAFTVKSGFGC